MKNQSHVSGSVMGHIYKLIDELPPLSEKKDPAIAAVAGVFGAVGIGLYFQNRRDFLWSFGLCVAVLILAAPTGELLSILAPIFCAIYGYRRAKSSNAKLAARRGNGNVIDVEVVTANSPAIPPIIARPATAFVPTTAETQLRHINDLLAKRLISQADHDKIKQQILNQI